MRNRRRFSFRIVIVLTAALASNAQAEVTEYFYEAEWEAAVGGYTTIDFTGFPDSTIITTQYQRLGVTFTDGNDFIGCCGIDSFPIDGAGLNSSGDDKITLVFDTPQNWIATNHPGVVVMQLYSQGQLIHDSSGFGGSGAGHFGGLVSDIGFDKAVLYDPGLIAAIDNLRFGGIPAPSALSLFSVFLLRHSRHRRGCRA